MAELKFEKLPDNMSAQERKLIEYHRNNLNKGTYLDDEQGMTTVYETGKSSNKAAIKLHDVIGRDGDLFRSFKYGERPR
jgi:hypothetical protein